MTCASVRKLRDRVGDDVGLRVDANEGYRTVSEAVQVTRRQVDEAGIFLCEQPMAGAQALAEVAKRIDVPVMADESAWTTQDITELAALGAATTFSLYVTKPGGLHRAREQATVAASLGFISDIGLDRDGGRQRRQSAPGRGHVDRDTAECLSRFHPGPVRARRGRQLLYGRPDRQSRSDSKMDACCSDGPGLGVEVDQEKIEAYAR